jgi:thiol-disulfide isomerase/thioredoxin
MPPRRALLAAALALPAALRAQPAAPVAPAAPAKGALVFDEPGRIDAAPLFAAALADLDHRAARVPREGRPLLVNFWARWCGPCKVEIPELVALQARRSGVDVLGIALENDGAAVRDFARAYEINYPLLLARDGLGLDLMRTLGNPGAGLPFTLGLDRRGALVLRRLGLITREQIDSAVRHLLR